jgi:hypothetical protein
MSLGTLLDKGKILKAIGGDKGGRTACGDTANAVDVVANASKEGNYPASVGGCQISAAMHMEGPAPVVLRNNDLKLVGRAASAEVVWLARAGGEVEVGGSTNRHNVLISAQLYHMLRELQWVLRALFLALDSLPLAIIGVKDLVGEAQAVD